MAMKTFKEYLNPIDLKEHLGNSTKSTTDLLVDAVYSQYAQSGTMGPEVVGWLDGESNHRKRMEVIYSAGINENDSVLDVGCGVCHLHDYMREQGWNGEYFGVDPNQKALKLVHEGVKTQCGLITDLKEGKQWDWVIASGVFNIGLQEDHMKWTVHDMHSRARKGLVVNYLRFPYENEQYQAYVPEEIKSWMKFYNPSKIDIKEDYLVDGNKGAEFTVYFYV